MGGNGSHASGILNTESGRAYKTLFKIGVNIIVLEQKDPKKKGKLPEESHTPNRIYVSFMADGKDVKEIAKYDKDGKKVWAIHTQPHKDLTVHYHIWKDGKPSKDGYPLTTDMQRLLNKVRNYGTDSK